MILFCSIKTLQYPAICWTDFWTWALHEKSKSSDWMLKFCGFVKSCSLCITEATHLVRPIIMKAIKVWEFLTFKSWRYYQWQWQRINEKAVTLSLIAFLMALVVNGGICNWIFVDSHGCGSCQEIYFWNDYMSRSFNIGGCITEFLHQCPDWLWRI